MGPSQILASLQSMFWHPSSNILFATTVDSELWMWKIPSGESKIYAGIILISYAQNLCILRSSSMY